MARGENLPDVSTAETRSKGGLARAEKVRAEKDEARRLLLEARRERLDAAIERLAAAAERAAAVIEELLGATSETVRLRSAVALLEILDHHATRELAERLERLEALAGSNGRRS